MYAWCLVGLVGLGEVLLGISPKADRTTWALENFPVWIGLGLFLGSYRRFPLTGLCLTLLAVHAFILMAGGYYTYAKVPLGFWAKDLLGFTRNHYDRLGHFAQGFAPSIFVRELLIRHAGLARKAWLPFLTCSVCLAFSAFYEFIEWWTALLVGEKAEQFLGTQGDVWDTQWDMFLALVGAVTALALLSRRHDKSLAHLQEEQLCQGLAAVK